MIYAAEELMCLSVAPLMCVWGRANGIGPSFGAITTDRTKATITSSRFSSLFFSNNFKPIKTDNVFSPIQNYSEAETKKSSVVRSCKRQATTGAKLTFADRVRTNKKHIFLHS